ncbi:reverse transcriptase domain-containing protein [Tanacetum coccineum]
MLTMRQGMSFAEIENIVSRRVTNAIEDIAIYETKICMAHELIVRVKRKVVRAHTARPGNKSGYAGKSPLCNRLKLHHTRPCIMKCNSYKRVGHMTREFRTPISITAQRPVVANQKPTGTYFGCGAQGHYKSECPKLKSQNCGNQKGKKGKARKDCNVVTDNVNT